TEINTEKMEIQSNKLEENELSSSSEEQQEVKKNDDVIVPKEVININNNSIIEKEYKYKIEEVTNEHIEINKNIINNENEILETKLISKVDPEFQSLIDIIESKSKSQFESETSIISHTEENDVNK